MATKIVIEDIVLIAPDGYELPSTFLEGVPECCGAGDGIGNTIIPDSIYGLKISIACDIHDYDFDVAEPTWEAFHAASNRFIRNIYAIIRARSNWLMGYIRILRAATYFYMVDTVGAKVFEALKKKQGYESIQ